MKPEIAVLAVLLLTAALSGVCAVTEEASGQYEGVGVQSSNGILAGLAREVSINGFAGRPSSSVSSFWTVYVPATGNVWAGGPDTVKHLALVDGTLMGFFHDNVPNVEQLQAITFATKTKTDLKDPWPAMNAVLKDYTNSVSAGPYPRYTVRLEFLLSSRVFRDVDTNTIVGMELTSSVTLPSKLKSVTVEGTNALVAIQIGTNVLARIAFNNQMLPVWATTNGVSIGLIPTNTVFFRDLSDGKYSLKVVY